MRVWVAPWFFRLPRLRRYDGYALKRTILLRRRVAETQEDLITHELCHIWQQQHQRWRVLKTWATTPYEENPYELEARQAVAHTTENPVRPSAAP